jgi:hypothetical protein
MESYDTENNGLAVVDPLKHPQQASTREGSPSKPRCGRKKNSGEQLLNLKYRGRAYAFYLRQPWDKWWEEFCASTMPSGALRYPTTWSFAKAKANGIQEQRWIQGVIGPKPDLEDGRKRPPIPWLGDWQQRRQMGFWFGTEKAEALAKVLKDRADGLEAARAVAGISAGWLRRAEGLANQADNYFGGQILIPNLSVKQNRQRADLYLRVLKELFQMASKATSNFLACHGIHQDDVTILAQMQAVSIRSATQCGIAKASAEMPEGITIDDVLMGKMLRDKAALYKMSLPLLGIENNLGDLEDDEFLVLANSSRFSNLAAFMKTVVNNESGVSSCRPKIEEYCKATPIEHLRQLRKEIQRFYMLLKFCPSVAAATGLLRDKLDCPFLQKGEEWVEVSNHFLTVVSLRHGTTWWEGTEAE